MTKRAICSNAVDSVHHKADRISKVEISPTSLAAVTRKISSPTYLVEVDVVVHVKDKIFKPKQRLPLKKLLSEQL